MKRHISVLICALVVVSLMLALASCGEKPHTYSDKWSYDETNHWHAATCEDGDECKEAKASVAAHADANNDKVCDVCAYDYNHEHTYATEYTSDKDAHWYAASCGCTVEGSGKGAHVDANNDGACDTCAYNGGHEHEIDANAWASDDTNHWHPVNCGHSVEEKEEHDYNDVDVCETCGHVKGGMDVADAVAIGDYYGDLVNGAVVNYQNGTDGYISNEMIIYSLGNASSKIIVGGDEYATTYWYTLYNGPIFGVVEYSNGSVEKPYEPASGLVDGYAFENIFGGDGDTEDIVYGANAIIPYLYGMSGAENVYDFEAHSVTVEGETAYVITFNRVFPYEETTEEGKVRKLGYLWSVEAVFTLSDSNTYETIAITSAKYNAEAVVVTDSEGNETVNGYSKIGLSPSIVYNYAVAQTIGERNLEFKYDPAKLLISDFEIYEVVGEDIADEPVDETITIQAGKTLGFVFGSVTPGTANFDLNSIEVSYSGLSYAYYSDWSGKISVTAGVAGEHTFTVTAGLVEKTYKVIVEPAPVTEIYPIVNYEEVVGVYSVYSVNGQPVSITFGAGVNTYANGAYTASLPAMSMQNSQLVDNGDGTYTVTVTPDRGGNATSTVILTSAVDPEVSAELNISIVPAPTVPELLNGTWEAEINDDNIYQYGTTEVTVTFTPLEEGATAGTVSIVASAMGGHFVKTDELSYVYDAETGVITLTDSDDKTLGYTLSIDESYSVALTFAFGTAVMSRPDTSIAGQLKDTDWISEETYEAGWGTAPLYQLTFNKNGTGWLTVNETGLYPDFEWVVDNETGVITLTYVGNNPYTGEFSEATITYNAEDGTITAVFGETTITFVEN